MTDRQLPSVTSILGVLDKPGLLYWAAQETARAAVERQNYWHDLIVQDGEAAAIKWLTNARYRRPQGELGASELGTLVHECFEYMTLDGKRPRRLHPEVEAYAIQFEQWLQDWQPTIEMAELTVFDLEAGYAGTADGVMTLDGDRLLFDYKTTRKAKTSYGKPTRPYPEVALQLAAYRYAELCMPDRAPRRDDQGDHRVYLFGDREQDACADMPVVQGAIAIHVTPEHCHAHPVVCSEAFHRIFLHLVEVFDWKQNHSKKAVEDKI